MFCSVLLPELTRHVGKQRKSTYEHLPEIFLAFRSECKHVSMPVDLSLSSICALRVTCGRAFYVNVSSLTRYPESVEVRDRESVRQAGKTAGLRVCSAACDAHPSMSMLCASTAIIWEPLLSVYIHPP